MSAATPGEEARQGAIVRAPQLLLGLFALSLPLANPSVPLLGYRVIAADFLFVALAAAWAATLAAGRTRFIWDRSYLLIAAYFAAVAASAVASEAPRTSAAKMLTQLYLVALPVLAINLVRDTAGLKALLRWWLAGTAIVALVAAASLLLFLAAPESPLLAYSRFHLGTLPPGDYPRLRMTFANANMACNYLSVSLAMLLAARRLGWLGRSSFLWLVAGVLLAAAFTISPGLGGIALVIGLWLWLTLRQRALARLALAAGAGAALLFLLAAAVTPYLHPTAPFLIELPLVEATIAPSGRLMLWIDAVRAFAADPLLGRGIGVYPVLVQYLSPSGHLQTLADAHNSFLNIAAQAGIVGLAALLALTVHVMRRAGPLRLAPDGANALRLALGLGFLSAFVYQGLTGSFEDARHLWLLVGLIAAADRIERDRAIAPPPSAA
ncbi:MAG: O-antigen ligase family protein [Pseudomonadota bacterium]|nr:O-antigen ligase family protein [Pseudomonadota bacterium]